jgi:hypothetical protein
MNRKGKLTVAQWGFLGVTLAAILGAVVPWILNKSTPTPSDCNGQFTLQPIVEKFAWIANTSKDLSDTKTTPNGNGPHGGTIHYTTLKLVSPQFHEPPQEGDIRIIKVDAPIIKDTHKDGSVFSGVQKNALAESGENAEAIIENHSYPLVVTYVGHVAIYTETNSIHLAEISKKFRSGQNIRITIPEDVTKLICTGKTTSEKSFSFVINLPSQKITSGSGFCPITLISCQDMAPHSKTLVLAAVTPNQKP